MSRLVSPRNPRGGDTRRMPWGTIASMARESEFQVIPGPTGAPNPGVCLIMEISRLVAACGCSCRNDVNGLEAVGWPYSSAHPTGREP